MGVALLALFVALGGVGYAASQINGKKLKNRSVAAKKLKKHTFTGTEIDKSKLGVVPKAAAAGNAANANNAGHAGSADKATNADKAKNADHATSADTADKLSDRTFRSISYSKTESPTDSGTTILSAGPLTLKARCTQVGINHGIVIDATTTTGNADLVASRGSGGAMFLRNGTFNGTVQSVVPMTQGDNIELTYRSKGTALTSPTNLVSADFGVISTGNGGTCRAFGHAEWSTIGTIKL
jgi:hypothetical protein